MKFILIFLVGAVFIYLLCAFFTLHIDFTLWSEGVRFLFCDVECVLAFVTIGLSSVEIHYK